MPIKLYVIPASHPCLAAEKMLQHKGAPEVCGADLAQLPELLDHVDSLIADGVIGGDELNAADFQIAPGVRLLMALDQLRPMIEGRPAAALATRVVPNFRGRVPAGLPADWLPES